MTWAGIVHIDMPWSLPVVLDLPRSVDPVVSGGVRYGRYGA